MATTSRRIFGSHPSEHTATEAAAASAATASPPEPFVPTAEDTTPASELLAAETATPGTKPTAAAPSGPRGRHVPSFSVHPDLGSFVVAELAAELALSGSSTVYLDYDPVSAADRRTALLDGGIDSVYDQVRQLWAFSRVPQDVLAALKAALEAAQLPAAAV